MQTAAPPSLKLSRLHAQTTSTEGQSILIVEDNRAVGALLSSFLHELGGFEIEVAGSLNEARDLVANNPARFFCAALDLNLPDAPNGEIVDLIRGFGIPAIVLTGTSDEAARQSVLQKNVVDYVVKASKHQIEHVAYLIGRLRENRAKKVLVVDDSRSYRAHLSDLLARYFYQTFEATDGVQALEILTQHPDMTLVITDINMPHMDGFDLINGIRQLYRREELAIIGLSDSSQVGLSARILKAGANDFLAKQFEIEEFYCRVTQNTNMVGYVRQVHHTANRDFLTGVYNRRYLFDIGEKLHANARRGNIELAASLLDIDHFKRVNDLHGHQVGDRVLQAISASLLQAFRKTDVVARYGGEEFVCLAIVKERAHAIPAFERVRKSLAAIQIETPQGPLSVTGSFGVTTNLGENLDEMLKFADEAVYAAKAAGRNCVVER